jgi:ubiquinone/menaquinone biosynthesis C-methylase UbiE
MLAPRKKLWSTPPEVMEKAIELLGPLSNDDIVFDIGAGDGRFIIRCHQLTGARCIGIEIDEERAAVAEESIVLNNFSSECRIIVGNALEQDYSSATAFFLYLVPRGLRLVLPILQKIPRKIRVVTYMSPFPDSVSYQSCIRIGTEKHPEAQWPLYVYTLNEENAEYECS